MVEVDLSTQTRAVRAGPGVTVQMIPAPAMLARPDDWVDPAALGTRLESTAHHVRTLLAFVSETSAAAKSAEDWEIEGRGWASLAIFDRAADAYSQAARTALPNKRAALHMARGVALADLGRHQEALSAFDRALDLNGSHSGAARNRGVTLARVGRDEEALSALDQVSISGTSQSSKPS